MNRRGRILKSLMCALSLLTAASVANAQATRTWVSGVGDDVNPCSRTAPCKTFAGAISKTAAGGQINVLDPGAFGTLTITKSITVDAGGIFAGVLGTGTNGFIVNALSTDRVVIRGMTIEGGTTGLNGIRFIAGGSLSVEDCVINNFSQRGIDVEPSATTGTVTVMIKNTIIRNNTPAASNAVLLKAVGTATINAYMENVTMDHNSIGLFAQQGVKVTVRNSSATNNSNAGFQASAGIVQMNLDECIASNNSNGVRVDGSGAVARISNVTAMNNSAAGVNITNAGQVVSFQNNRFGGNLGGDILPIGGLTNANEL
jgi:hypothetical protein